MLAALGLRGACAGAGPADEHARHRALLLDFALYYDMAERGLIGNDNLIAPFVYRFLTPLAGDRADSPIEHTAVSALHLPGTCSTPRRIPALS